MTITPFELYMILKLDNFQVFLIVVGILGTIICGFATVWALSGDCETIFPKLIFPLLTAVTATSLVAGVLLPSTKQAAVIYIAPKVINSDIVQNDIPREAKEIYALAKQWLRDAVKEGEGKR